MQPYILFGAKGCGSVITEGFLRYADVPYELHELQWEHHEQWPAILARFNPLAQVPTLVLPNGEILTETLATAAHLAGYRPGLIPSGAESARFWRWATYLVANVYPTFFYFDNSRRFVTDDKARTEFENAVLDQRKDFWRILESECGAPWFLGETFSAIDIYLAVMTQWTPRFPWFRAHCPRLAAVADAVSREEFFAGLHEANTND